jgi:hypothetical protein
MRLLLATALALSLAACQKHEAREEARRDGPVTAKGEAAGTTFAARADAKSGAVEVALPGAKLSLDGVGKLMGESNFDLDGTKLYPGSKIETLDVRAFDSDKDEAGRARVHVAFLSPAEPGAVKSWFLKELGKRGGKVAEKDGALTGETQKGSDYRITLAAAGAGQTRGEILIEDESDND